MSSSSINRQPFGMLGFLGIKNGGRNPETFGEVLVPTWDLQALYQRTNAQPLRIVIPAPVVGIAVAQTVPDGEVWAVHGGLAESQNVLTAGQSFTGFLAAFMTNAPAGAPHPLGEMTSAATGAAWCSPFKWPVPQYLRPGTQIGVYGTALAAGPIPVSVHLWYSRLET